MLLQQLMARAVGELRLLAAHEVSPEAWPRQRVGRLADHTMGRLAVFAPGDVVAYVRQVLTLVAAASLFWQLLVFSGSC